MRIVSLAFLLLLSHMMNASPVTLKGDFVQGGMIIGQAQPGSSVMLNKKLLQVAKDGSFVFGLDRDAESGDVLEVQTKEGDYWQKNLVVKPRQYNIQRVEGISKGIMSKQKPDATWSRIRREGQEISTARKKDLQLLAFKDDFKWPLNGPITGVFGSQRVYNGEPGRPHYGVDIAAPIGTPAGSPADGVITYADDMYYSGGTVVIDHGHGISSSFLHLSKIRVNVGDVVKQGRIVGEVGAGGRASGPHLDWRMNWFNRRIDPQLLVPPMSNN